MELATSSLSEIEISDKLIEFVNCIKFLSVLFFLKKSR